MSVQAVVKKDFRDGMRSKLLWALVALYFVVLSGWAYVVSSGVDEVPEGTDILSALGTPALVVLLLFVPTTALAVSIKSIVRERELGSLKVLLSLPHTRAEVLAGKFVGRAGLLALAILAGFLPAGLILLLRVDGLSAGNYLVFVLLTVLFGVAFLAVGLGLSALLRTETRATVAGVSAFFLLLLWNWLFGFVNDRLELLDGAAVIFVRRFNLLYVFMDLFTTLAPSSERGATEATTAQLTPPQVVAEAGLLDGDPAFYLQSWFAVVILALWIAVPLLVGYYRFETAAL